MTVFRKREDQEQDAGNAESILLSILSAINAGNSAGDTSNLNLEETQLLIKDCLCELKEEASFKGKLLEVDQNGTDTYLGYADPGSLTSDPVWAIKKWEERGTDATAYWVDGGKSFDNIWDNRLSLTYS